MVQGADPGGVVVEAGNQHQVLAAGADELLAAAHADFLQSLDAVGDERRAHHQQALHPTLHQFVELGVGIGLDPLGAPQARLERHRPAPLLQAGALGEGLGGAQALAAVAEGEGFGADVAAVLGQQVVGRILHQLADVPLGQAMEAQQQMVVGLLQVRTHAFHQGIEVDRLVVERRQRADLQAQAMGGDHPAHLLFGGGRSAVGELRIQRRQGDPPDTTARQVEQDLLDGRLAVAHRQFHRSMRPVRLHRFLQATTEDDQWRPFVPPDRAVGVRRFGRTLDQDQRHQQAPQRPG